MTDDLPCRELVELVTEHLEGALDPVTEQRLLDHLTGCGGCADFVAQLRRTRELSLSLPPETVPDALRDRLAEAYRRRR